MRYVVECYFICPSPPFTFKQPHSFTHNMHTHSHIHMHVHMYTHTHAHSLRILILQPSAVKDSTAYFDTYRDEWREVFIISAELYAFGAIIYLLLGSGQKQYWADGWPRKTIKNSLTQVEKPSTIKHSIQVEASSPGRPDSYNIIQAAQPHSTYYGAM